MTIEKLMSVLPNEHNKLAIAAPTGSKAINLIYFYKRGCLIGLHEADVFPDVDFCAGRLRKERENKKGSRLRASILSVSG